MISKILFNCTTNTVGGGIKNSSLFIKFAVQNSSFDWYFAISPQVHATLEKWNVDCSKMYVFEDSPARNKRSRKRLKDLTPFLSIDIVYTMAGPAYVSFSCKHVLGMSEPYVSHAGWPEIRKGRSLSGALKTIGGTFYKAFFARKADFWIFQTDYSRKSFSKRYFIPPEKSATIFNAIDSIIVKSFEKNSVLGISSKSQITILCPGGAYAHKVLDSIPYLAKELVTLLQGKKKVKFLLTIDESSKCWETIKVIAKNLGVGQNFETTGSYNYSQVNSILQKADLVYVPSILETFSASYIEAFAAKTPLVCADRNFAKDVCGKGALYVDPFKPKLAAEAAHELINSDDDQINIMNEGVKRLQIYGDQESRFKKICKILEEEAQIIKAK